MTVTLRRRSVESSLAGTEKLVDYVRSHSRPLRHNADLDPLIELSRQRTVRAVGQGVARRSHADSFGRALQVVAYLLP